MATGVGHLRKVSETHYQARSMHSQEWSEVVWRKKRWACNCPGYPAKRLCEHVIAVTIFQSLPSSIMMTLNYELLTCPECGSGPEYHVPVASRRRKFGRTTQYQCKRCGHYFTDRFAFVRMRNNPAYVMCAIDLYCAGLPVRVIANHLSTVWGLQTSHMSVYRWVRKFTAIASAFAKKLRPRVGKKLHIDEMVIPVGGEKGYLWNALDARTKFLLASLLTMGRSEKEAEEVISAALAQGGSKPEVAVTDGLASYRKPVRSNGIKKHVFRPRFADPVNNLPVENLNSQLRPKYNMAKSFGSPQTGNITAAAVGLHYNYVRRKEALGNETPGERAGIKVKGRNQMLGLVWGAGSGAGD